jgi:crotonobetainyl-CoA:carnitine CoA-transferase CaiB-like acyl-CoA transferase
MEPVLAGIRVLDFGRYIAGPYCAALLADLGADVIRIERRDGGEDRWVAPVGEDGVGAMYVVMNRNKRAMTLDPSSPRGREIVTKLVATADVVVANLPPDVLRHLSLDLESLRRVKPDIILTTVTAFGAGGPWSRKHGFDGIGQAMCGSAYLTGTPEQPLRAAVAWVDCGTASLAALGTLAALMARQKNGRGQKVEGALLRTAVAFNNPALVEQQVVKPDRLATVNRGQTSAPSDLFRTKDGWIIAYAIGGPMYRRWARLMGEEHWLTDPRFKDDLARGDHGSRKCRSRPARSIHPSKRWRTLTSAPPVCSWTPTIRGCRARRRWRRRPSISPRRRAPSVIARPSSASTPTRSSPSSAIPPTRSASFTQRASSSRRRPREPGVRGSGSPRRAPRDRPAS